MRESLKEYTRVLREDWPWLLMVCIVSFILGFTVSFTLRHLFGI